METDVAVIGSGPAGLQAAIHSARRKVSTLVVGKMGDSDAYGIKVENYFGFPGTESGSELLRNGREQAESSGARFEDMNILSAAPKGSGFEIVLENGERVVAKAVVLATGIKRAKLNVPGEKEFGNGKGVSYCASCDCNFYKGGVVAMVGGGSEAAVDAELMTKYASKTYWVAKRFNADESLVSRAVVAGAERIASEVVRINGDGRVGSISLSDGRVIPVDGVFIELGGRSSADIAMDLGIMPEVDDTIKVDRSCKTSVPGVFACGDITGKPWQIAKAVGEGAVAGAAAAEYAGRIKP